MKMTYQQNTQSNKSQQKYVFDSNKEFHHEI